MPDDPRALAKQLIEASPLMQIGKGIAKVGELAERGYETVKRTVQGRAVKQSRTYKKDVALPRRMGKR